MSDALFATRQMPQNIEAEQSLLGALLHNNKALDRCPGLKPEHFADQIHGRIFAEIVQLVRDGRLADAVTLKSRFENTGILDEIGGTPYLARLLASMVGILNAKEYAVAITDAAMRRRLISAAVELNDLAHGADTTMDAAAVARTAMSQIEQAIEIQPDSTLVSLDAAMDMALAAYDRATRGETSGISTGFRCLDARLGGLEPGLVYVLAGRPGMGKSALGHQIGINAARNGVGVLELSLEMSAQQLGRRTLATAASLPIAAIKRGQPDVAFADKILRARKELAGLPLSIDDATAQTTGQIAEKAHRYRRKHGLGLVIIDHLHLVRAESQDARHGGTWAVERASGAVLEVAKTCGCPVLLLAQLSRGVEGRDDKRPGLADLRQAGAIEQDAYAVGFVYRAEYYLGTKPERTPNESDIHLATRLSSWEDQRERERGKADVIWGKVRDGESGVDHLTFDGPTASFGEAVNG